MATVSLDFTRTVGKIKPMHAVNNGPIRASNIEQSRGNFDTYQAAHIPFARNHDASFYSGYGGEHTVDVHAIFPDFTKNPYDADSYDFTLTDEYLTTITDASTEVYYRLGSKIEHWTKKYGTIVPADFQKWAVVCEHIVRHYNEGWSNGYHLGIRYWEIWNEPDGVKANGDQPNWSGTPAEFYELYITAAAHLKKRFPALKIGGPALSWLAHRQWMEDFLAVVRAAGDAVPLDFFSWHTYLTEPHRIAEKAELVRSILDSFGFTHTESHLNEYNYVENWTDRFIDSILAIISERGAAFTAAAMAVGQSAPLDMLMYYDARPGTFNGLFDYYTLRPLKGYYPFAMFSTLYQLGDAAAATSDDAEVYAVAATDGTTNAAMITYYANDRAKTESKTVDILCPGTWHAHLVDKDVTMEECTPEMIDGGIRLTLRPNSVVLLEN